MSKPSGDTVRTILTADDRLDDITRARMWSRIEDRLDAPVPQHAGSKRTAAIVLAAVAAAATIVLVIRTFPARDDHDLTVAADAILTSRLGPHARAALVGPARLELLGPAGDVTAARLHDGTLLAEFEGGPGRGLRIEAGDLIVEIVGTLFAIEVHGREACVAVAHGTVRVTSHAEVQLVTDRQQLCSGELAPHAIPDPVSDQLARHARSIAIALAPPVPVDPVSPPSNRSAPADVAARLPGAPIVTAPSNRPEPPDVGAPSPRASIARATVPTVSQRLVESAPPAVVPPPRSPSPDSSSSARAERAPVESQDRSAPRDPVTTPTADVPPEPVTAAPPVAAPPSAEALYHAAEVALAAGDRAAADRALARILAMSASALADQALYERARIAYQNRSWPAARRFLATLATYPNTPLAEPGRYLDCRIAVQAGDRDAERCFLEYRSAYPQSPHDLDVLAVLAQLAHARAGCPAARTAREELIARYPRTDRAAAWRSRCPETP